MTKIITILLIVFNFNTISASPGRFQGYSYSWDEKGRVKITKSTEEFNKKKEPSELKKPYYLENPPKNKPNKGKHKMVPTYSEIGIHDKNYFKKAKTQEDNKEDSPNETDEDTEKPSNNKEDSDSDEEE